jgi:hypothetical protein
VGFFNKKKKAFKEIEGGTWGHLVRIHKENVDTLWREMRCVERGGTINGREPVTLIRIFSLKDVEAKGVEVAGWETFDTHPDLILYEGYLTQKNQAHMERKGPKP